MSADKIRKIVYLIINNHPGISRDIMLGNLLKGEFWLG